MDTTDDIVAVEAEYRSLLNDPRRPLSRFVEVSVVYGRMLAEPDPHHAAEVYGLALDTLHDPPAPAEVDVAIELIRALRPVAARIGSAAAELDAIRRERRLLDLGLVRAEPGVREALCRRAAAVRFAEGEVAEGFVELMDGLRACSSDGLDDLATDLVLAVRHRHVPDELTADIENMWVELRRQRFDGNWPLWCLTALGALRLDGGDVVTAQMYVRRAESILGHIERPVAGALVGGWVALAADDFGRAHDRFTFASNAGSADVRMRLLAAAGLGEALICLGRPEEARGPLAEAISFDVGDPQSVGRCHELLAEIAAADGRHAEAYEHLQMTRRLEQLARGGAAPVVRLQQPTETLPMAAGESEPGPDAAEARPPVSELDPDVVDLRDERRNAPVDLADPAIDLSPAPTPAPAPAPAPPSATERTPDGATGRLIEALRSGWLDLYFQAIDDNTRHRPGAAEALLRIRHPERGLVLPEEYLDGPLERDVAEELCMWTMTRACEALARWTAGGAAFAVVVGVSEAQLTPALPLIVRTALARSGARPDLLTVEVDGSAAGRIDAEQIELLNEIRSTGARIGIDRFGGEFRSIDTLLRLPIDVVKFDRSVFGGGALQPLGRRMVDTVVALARAFGFEVIATGIDSPAQLDLQQQFGCHGAQGLLLGAPVPEPEFRQLLNVA